MKDFGEELETRLARIREQGFHRVLRRIDSPQTPRIRHNGVEFLNFSSNDYLGLANEPLLKEAAVRAIDAYGVGAGASRLISGSLAPHEELEQALAEFKRAEGAITFSSGYAAALGAICSLLSKSDFIVIDKLVHASLVDAARLSGATLRVFAHNDLDDLEDILKWIDSRRRGSAGRSPGSNVMIVTESIFSMEGDHAPLKAIVELKEKFGAWLMVDEAHATGLYGANRRGLAEYFNVSDRIEVQMGTLGKALGAAGGYICGSRALIDYLVNRARSFVFSTAPVPAAAAAAEAGVRFVQSPAGEARRNLLWQNVNQVPARFRRVGPLPSAILPILTGVEELAVSASALLRERGLFVPAIRYPTVPRGKARLRVTLSAVHTRQDVACLSAALEQALSVTPLPDAPAS
jgi:8-amino-7-oxononanoate synthase